MKVITIFTDSWVRKGPVHTLTLRAPIVFHVIIVYYLSSILSCSSLHRLAILILVYIVSVGCPSSLFAFILISHSFLLGSISFHPECTIYSFSFQQGSVGGKHFQSFKTLFSLPSPLHERLARYMIKECQYVPWHCEASANNRYLFLLMRNML